MVGGCGPGERSVKQIDGKAGVVTKKKKKKVW